MAAYLTPCSGQSKPVDDAGAKQVELRYGENPHQRAAFYRTDPRPEPCAAHAEVLNGKALSYNNLVDLDAAHALAARAPRAGWLAVLVGVESMLVSVLLSGVALDVVLDVVSGAVLDVASDMVLDTVSAAV